MRHNFEYLEIISAASPQVGDRVNAGIVRVLLRQSNWPAADSVTRSLDAYADVFLKSAPGSKKNPNLGAYTSTSSLQSYGTDLRSSVSDVMKMRTEVDFSIGRKKAGLTRARLCG